MSTDSIVGQWRIVASISLLVLAAFVPSVTPAQHRTVEFDWTQQFLTATPLTLGVTTRREVFAQLLGPTYFIEGDGGQPSQLCYLHGLSEGKDVRVILSFFGSGDERILSTIEWQSLRKPVDAWVGTICQMPTIGRLPTGLAGGIKLGDLRTATRRTLGVPSKAGPSRDEYVSISTRGAGELSTHLELVFDRHEELIRLVVRQLETN